MPDFITIPLIAALLSAGAAWGTIRAKTAGLTERLVRIEKNQDLAHSDERGIADRLARLETKLDLLLAGQLNANGKGLL